MNVIKPTLHLTGLGLVPGPSGRSHCARAGSIFSLPKVFGPSTGDGILQRYTTRSIVVLCMSLYLENTANKHTKQYNTSNFLEFSGFPKYSGFLPNSTLAF